MKFTLSNVISQRIYDSSQGWIDKAIELTPEQKQAFLNIFGYRAKAKNKARLEMFINSPVGYTNYEIYERVQFGFDDIPCQYVAGQSYPDEVSYIRQLICK